MYDVIIIGGGPAGLNASLYCARGGCKTLLIEKLFCGGQAATTYEVENYIGFIEPISGPELVTKMEAHAKHFGVEIVNKEVTSLNLTGETKSVVCGSEALECKAVILCTGATPRTLGIPREEELRGFGVSYCATCDGAFYRNKSVAVIGGGDTAVEDALYLSRFCSRVYLVHRRDSLRAAKILSDKLLENEKVIPVWDSVVTSINGDSVVSGIGVKNVKTGTDTTLEINGMFVAVGTTAENHLFKDTLTLDDSGYIITDENMSVDIPGVYVAGDIRHKSLRQIITAAADGAIAANSAINYILTI